MDHRIGLAAGVGIALLVSVLGIVAVFMGYLTDPNRPVQVFSQSPSEGERGYQGIFDAEIHRCASSQPDRPLGGRWNVEEKRVEMVPAGWSELEPLCSGDNLLWRSDARVDPSLGQYVQLQWSFPYDVSVAAVQSDWLAVSGTSSIANRPFVAYGYQTGYYVVDTTQSDLDKELWWGDSAPDSWGDITSVSVDRDAFAAGSGADERDMTAVLDDLSDSSYVVAVGAGVYGVYAVASVTGTDNRTISVSSVRGVGVPPDDGRVEVRFYPDGGSRLVVNFAPSSAGAPSDLLQRTATGYRWVGPQAAVYSGRTALVAGSNVTFTADDTAQTVTIASTASGESTQADAEAGTDDATANASRMTPRRVKQAIDAQVNTEQVRIDEFIDADNVNVMDGYSIVASYTGSVSGSSIFAQDTYSIYYQNASGVSQREFLRHIKAGWQFLLHRQTTPPQYVFSDVTGVEWQDVNGSATTTLSDTVTFKFTVAIDTERGLDAYGELTAGAVRIHWKVPLDETYVEVDGNNVTAELVEAIQGNNEDEALGAFTRVALGQEQSGDNRFGVGGALVFSVAEDANYQSATSDTNDAKLWRAAKERAWVRFGNGWEIEIVSLSARYIGTGRAQYSIGTWNVIAGTAPGLNSTTSVTIIGEDVHRGQLDEMAFTGLQQHGTILPDTCAVGLVFLLTQVSGSDTAGLYACLSSNIWTAVGP